MFRVLGSLAIITAAAFSIQPAHALDWKKTLFKIEADVTTNKKAVDAAKLKAAAEAAAAKAASEQYTTNLEKETAPKIETINAKLAADIEKLKKQAEADIAKVKETAAAKLKDLMKGESKEAADAAATLKAAEGNLARLEIRKTNVLSVGKEFDKVMAMPFKDIKDANKVCEAIDSLGNKIVGTQIASKGKTSAPLAGLAPYFQAAMKKRQDEVAKANKGLNCKTIVKFFDEVDDDEKIN